jgi:hypothetical protein
MIECMNDEIVKILFNSEIPACRFTSLRLVYIPQVCRQVKSEIFLPLVDGFINDLRYIK